MKVFANREIRNLFQAVLAVWAVALALTQGIVWYTTHAFSFALLLVFLLLGGCLWGVLFRYFQRQSALLEQAVQQIQSCLDGNPDARLDCDREGELYRLFHSVNALAAVLSAHADNEQREKRFLKNTIAAVSYTHLMNIIMGLELGGDDYLTKPFKLGVLLSRVNALLQMCIRDRLYSTPSNLKFTGWLLRSR